MFDLRFRNPSTFFLAGVSGSGKTHFVYQILSYGKLLFTNPSCINNALLFYSEWQDIYDKMLNEKLISECIADPPTTDLIKEKLSVFKDRGGSIVILDDLQHKLNQDIVDLFTVLSSHLNITVFILVQNLFPKERFFRDLSLNCKYVVIFKNPRDPSQVSHFARQVRPRNSKFVLQVVEEATKLPHSYILFDFHQDTPVFLSIRSNILPEEQGPISVWIEKNK